METGSGRLALNYVVAGANAKPKFAMKNKSKVPKRSLRYFFPTLSSAHGGLVYAEIKPHKATFHYYECDETVTETYKFSIPPRQKKLRM